MMPNGPPEDSLSWRTQEDTSFTKAVRNLLVGKEPASLRTLVLALLWRPDPRVPETVTKLGLLIGIGLMGHHLETRWQHRSWKNKITTMTGKARGAVGWSGTRRKRYQKIRDKKIHVNGLIVVSMKCKDFCVTC